MGDDARVEWLRKQIDDDLKAATIISDGGFSPEMWTTDPPGQVNPAEHPASAAITALVGEDEPDAYPMTWTALIAWEKENHEPEPARVRSMLTTDGDGEIITLPSILVANGRRQADHICRHDPRNVVADCEAKLAIIEEHPEIIEWNDVVHSAVGRCARCQNWMFAMAAPWPCTTLRQLATAYRHREGYAEHWGAQ